MKVPFSSYQLATVIWSIFPFASRTAAVVKRIQAVQVTVNNASATGTATLGNAVVVANSMLLWNGQRGGTNAVDQAHTLDITNTTTVTATRNGTAGAATVYGIVVEFVGVTT